MQELSDALYACHCSAELMQEDAVGLSLKGIRCRCIVTDPLFCSWTDATATCAAFHCIRSVSVTPMGTAATGLLVLENSVKHAM